MTQPTFIINWFDGNNASVTFSDGPVSRTTDDAGTPQPETPFIVPNCPLDDTVALMIHISDWWVAHKAANDMPMPVEAINLIGIPLTVAIDYA